MRSQECRKHIQKTGKVCNLKEETINEVQKVLDFCEDHPEISQLSTDAAKALMDIPDPMVQQKAISHVGNALNRKTPTGGTYKKRLTKPEVEKAIKKILPPENVIKESGDVKSSIPKKQERITLHPKIKQQDPDKCYSPQPGSIPKTDTPILSLGEQVRKQEAAVNQPEHGRLRDSTDPEMLPPRQAPCILSNDHKVCPDLENHLDTSNKAKGRVCDILRVPIIQLPGKERECPLEKKERLKNTPPEQFIRASGLMDEIIGKPIKQAPYKILKSLLTDGERDTATDALIERTRFSKKDIEQIDELVTENREGWTCRFDLIEAAVMMLLAKAEGA